MGLRASRVGSWRALGATGGSWDDPIVFCCILGNPMQSWEILGRLDNPDAIAMQYSDAILIQSLAILRPS